MAGSKAIEFILNDKTVSETLPPGMVVLDYLRRHRRMTGTKEGCREGDCGACMVLLGRIEEGRLRYRAVNSCLLPLAELDGRHLVTIEGLNGDSLNPIQQAFFDENASQCGFCTPGMIVSLTGFYLNSDTFTSQQAVAALDGNICRCTGYTSIKRAAGLLAKQADNNLAESDVPRRIQLLVEQKILPSWFLTIFDRLSELQKPLEKERSTTSLLVAGGTDLFVQKPEALLDADFQLLTRDKNLAEIKVEGDLCRIGAAVTVEQLQSSPLVNDMLPDLRDDLRLVSSTPIRSRATVGGNIVNASPIGDLTIWFLALDAAVALNDGVNRRIVALKDFFLDYKKLDKKDDELLEWVQFAIFQKGSRFNFEKVSKRTHLDIASVNSAMLLRRDGDVIVDAGISAGGVAPIPLTLSKTVDFLRGEKLSAQTVKKAAHIAQSEISPISDVRGSAQYKRLLLRQLIFAHFDVLFREYSKEALL
ncbi:MAG: 2Fe-2S iron-sulfur cluster binding domain-containing protein [Actinobacteria bacterium]|nr:2Fe-2S iron-sulfur cluster binding domain-containing protein [Actinomycetota bacterium]